MSTRISTQRGFTLVELLMAMAFFSFTLVLIATSFIQILRIYQSAVVTKNAQNTAKSIFEQISRDVREGDTVEAVSATCFNIGDYYYVFGGGNTLWRIPTGNGNNCDPNDVQNIPTRRLMHEDNLSVYAFTITPVAALSGGSARSAVMDMTLGVLNSTSNELVNETTQRCQTDPSLLRLCSVVQMHTAVSVRDLSL